MMLPPTSQPPDPDSPSQSEPGSGPGTPSSQGTLAHPARHGRLEGERRPRVALRSLLLMLSGLGVGTACVLWAAGHPTLAARLLAGDVLLIFVVLVAVQD